MHSRVLRFASLGLLAAACGSGPSPSPAQPVAVATPVPPTPTPSPTPDPTIPPPDSGCGQPYPAPISRVDVKVHLKDYDFWTMDATPLVGPDARYCAQIGFTDNRRYCPVRPEGHPERFACEDFAVGKARDTGRPGPTWTFGDALCTGRETGCENRPDNQYLINAYKYGVYRACAKNGVCGEELAEPHTR